jgi:hypothetical protein
MELLPMLQKIAPCVRNVSLLPFFLIAVIQVDDIPPTQRGIGKNIAMAALSHPWIKIAVVVDKGISIGGAIIALLFGYRKLGKKPGESLEFDKWYEKWGKVLRFCGWGMLVCFVPLLIADLVRVVGR